jgi:hypothetical protein
VELKSEHAFDTYDVTAVVVPGASLLLGLWLLGPHLLPAILNPTAASLGGFGIFAVAAFCVGHVVQAPANAITDLGWHFFGRPTEKMRKAGCGLPGAAVAMIPDQLHAVLRLAAPTEDTNASWQPITAQMAVAVANASRDRRLQKFNGNFGLFRGLTMSLALLAMLAAYERLWVDLVMLLLLTWATRFRMKRFSGYYARELWMQFLALDASRMES